MIDKYRRCQSLASAISIDLIRHGKIALLLLAAILLSSVLVVTITYKTRLLTVHHEELVLEHYELDIEWRKLILEENALSDDGRVERKAINKLQMKHINPLHENIVREQ